MDIAPALLEYWLRDRYFTSEIDIGGSGVENFSFAELRELLDQRPQPFSGSAVLVRQLPPSMRCATIDMFSRAADSVVR